MNHALARPHSARLFFAASLSALLALVVPAVAQEGADESDPQEQLRQLMLAGQTQLEEEKYQEAVDSLSKAIQLSGGFSALPYLQRARAFKELEEYEAALEDIKEVLTYSGSVPAMTAEAHNLRGEVNLERGAPSVALPDLEAAASEDRSNMQYQFNLGKAYALLGLGSQAEKLLTQFIESDSENTEAFRLRAQAWASQGKFEEALADIDQSLEIDSSDYEAYFAKGQILLMEEEYIEAADALKLAIDNYEPEEDSDLPFIQAQLTRASALEEAAKLMDSPEEAQQAYQEEKKECERLLDALPDRPDMAGVKAAALFRLGVAQRLLDELRDAIEAFSDAIDLNPAMAEAYFRRGICFFHLGEDQLAIRDFEQAASIDFETPRADLWKGRTHAKLGDYYEAIASYGDALAVTDRYTDAYLNRGLAYCRLGEWKKAVSDFNEAIRLQPKAASHYLYRGVAFSQLKEHEKAIQSLAAAIEYDEELSPAYRYLAAELSVTGQSQLAREYLHRADQIDSDGAN